MIAIPLILVGLEVIVSWFVLFGARKSWLYFTGAIGRIIHKPTSFFRTIWNWTLIGATVTEVQAAISHGQDQLGQGAKEAEPTTAGFIAGTAAALDYHAFTTKYIAAGTLEALEALRGATIPRTARAHAGTAREQAEAAARQSRVAAREAARAETDAARAVRIAQHAHAEAIAHPWDTPATRAREAAHAISSWWTRHARAVATWTAAAIGAGAIVRVIVRRLPWFQCRNVDKAARNLCRMDSDLLDSLIADTLILAGSISLVEFVHACQTVTPVVEGGLRRLIRELH